MTETTEEVVIPDVDNEPTEPAADATAPSADEVNEPTVEVEAPAAVSVLDALRARMGTVQQKNNHLKMLVIGEPGVGKTTFAATAPKALVVDVEKGTAALVGSTVVDASKVVALEYKSFRQLELLIDALAQGEFPEFETIVIDSLSELAKKGLEEITEREYAASGGQRNQFIAETSDYSENNEHMRRIAAALRDLDRHIICISHPRIQENKATGIPVTRADFSERMAGTFNGIFDVVGYLTFDSGTGIRQMQVHPSNTVSVKTRVNGLPSHVENPTWDYFYDAFRKQHTL